jgi:hypothetical protein
VEAEAEPAALRPPRPSPWAKCLHTTKSEARPPLPYPNNRVPIGAMGWWRGRSPSCSAECADGGRRVASSVLFSATSVLLSISSVLFSVVSVLSCVFRALFSSSSSSSSNIVVVVVVVVVVYYYRHPRGGTYGQGASKRVLFHTPRQRLSGEGFPTTGKQCLVVIGHDKLPIEPSLEVFKAQLH